MIKPMFFSNNKQKEYVIKMDYDRSKPLTKRNVIEFIRNCGIEVKTNTKARGNQGIYLKNRIDISAKLNEDKVIEVLVHEFAHHIHYLIDENFITNGGSLEKLFDTNNTLLIKEELINITRLTDKNSRLTLFFNAKEETSKNIKGMQSVIKREYPNFMRSKKFPEFEQYIKNSDAKYLIKYDAVKLIQGFFFKKDKILTVKNIENDFPDMPKPFQMYIKLCSLQRKQSKLTRRINKLNKYYESPTELFARYVSAYFLTPETIETIAPITTNRFIHLLRNGYYKELKDLFEIFKNF